MVDPRQAFAKQNEIMNAPLTSQERAMLESHQSQLMTTPSWLMLVGAHAGVGALVGIVFGSEKHLRNAAIGSLVGVGVGMMSQIAVISVPATEVTDARRARYTRWLAEQK